MPITLRHEWLQKESTPGEPGGDFRWYPATVDADLRAAMAGRAGDGGQALWRIEPGRVAWAVSFSAVAEADRRRYVGLALTVAEGDAPASSLLRSIEVLPAAPWQQRALTRTVAAEPVASFAPAPRPVAPSTAGAVARGLWTGSTAAVPEPTDGSWPALFATLSTWLPDEIDRPRQGALAPPPATEGGASPLHHYLGLAWALPAAIAARDPRLGERAWCAALGLAERAGVSPDAIFDELAALARAWNTTDELAALLDRSGTVTRDEQRACDRRAPAPLSSARDAGWLWARVVHYWGRGFLSGAAIEDRLARLLARRVVADHLFHLDAPEQRGLPMRYVNRLRRESLVPRAHVDQLLARVAAEVPEVLYG